MHFAHLPGLTWPKLLAKRSGFTSGTNVKLQVVLCLLCVVVECLLGLVYVGGVEAG